MGLHEAKENAGAKRRDAHTDVLQNADLLLPDAQPREKEPKKKKQRYGKLGRMRVRIQSDDSKDEDEGHEDRKDDENLGDEKNEGGGGSETLWASAWYKDNLQGRVVSVSGEYLVQLMRHTQVLHRALIIAP